MLPLAPHSLKAGLVAWAETAEKERTKELAAQVARAEPGKTTVVVALVETAGKAHIVAAAEPVELVVPQPG